MSKAGTKTAVTRIVDSQSELFSCINRNEEQCNRGECCRDLNIMTRGVRAIKNVFENLFHVSVSF